MVIHVVTYINVYILCNIPFIYLLTIAYLFPDDDDNVDDDDDVIDIDHGHSLDPMEQWWMKARPYPKISFIFAYHRMSINTLVGDC